jgi:hypothetical protein
VKHLFIKLLFEHYVAFIFGLLLLIDAAITFALLFLLSLFPDYPQWIQDGIGQVLICLLLIVLVVPLLFCVLRFMVRNDLRAHPKRMLAYANGGYAYSSILRDCMDDYASVDSVLYAFEWRVERGKP